MARRNEHQVMTPAGLFDALAAIPELPGAACRGRPALFDPDAQGYDEVAALAICGQCAARSRCRSWFDGLTPRQRPEGVVAHAVHRREGRSNRSTITEEATP